jgi:hypothetical protein
MPRERIRKDIVYKFEELSENAQQKALEILSEVNTEFDWWDSTYADAETIGLKIEEFDIYHRDIGGKFTQSAEDVAKAIIENHGKNCETFKTASAYLEKLEELTQEYSKEEHDDDLDTEEIDREFLNDLLEDYLIILQHEYEYLQSREAIIEMIEANEYEFLEDGKIA